MWDLIVSVPDHCLPFYFVSHLDGSPEDRFSRVEAHMLSQYKCICCNYSILSQGNELQLNSKKNSEVRKICCNHPKTEQGVFTIMCSKDANRIANSVDPDQTTPLGAV